MNLLTVLEGAPMLIGDVTLLIDTAEKIVPEAVAAEKAIVAAVLEPARKLKADIHDMFAAGGGLVAIVADARTFIADAGALVTALGSLIPLVEAKAEAIWQDAVTPARKLEADLKTLSPS